MTGDELDREVDERGREAVEEAQRARIADQPTIALAEHVAYLLRSQREENHWATKVRQAFRESHG